MIHGRGIRVPVSRSLHHLYALPMQNLPCFSELLGDIGGFEKIRELSLAGTDQLFVMHWTCLSLVAIRPFLADTQIVRIFAGQTMGSFAEEDNTGNNATLATAQKVNETLQKASGCLFRLFSVLCETKDLTEVKEILRGHESNISELEQINIEAHLASVDYGTAAMRNIVNLNSHRIISQFPGIFDDFDFDYEAPIPFSHIVNLSHDPRKLLFICPWQTREHVPPCPDTPQYS